MHSSRPGWGYATISDALVLGFLPPVAAPPPLGFRGGPVLPSEYDHLRHHRGGVPVDSSYDVSVLDDSNPPDVIDEELAYGGPLINHFGHFLAESVHRIRATQVHRPDVSRWLFVGQVGGPATLAGYAPFITDVLHYLNIDPNDVVVVTRPTVVRSLAIHEQTSQLGLGPHPGYVEFLTSRDHSDSTLTSNDDLADRVYVSRTGSVIGSFLGERYLAAHLEREGFRTIRPETLPFADQVAVYRSAYTLLFAEGSAIHGTELLGAELNHVGIVRRRETAPANFSAILSPRAASVHEIGRAQFLGNRFRISGQEGISDGWGVSLMDPRALVNDLRASGAADCSEITVDDYLAAAANDLREYCQADAPAFMAPQDQHLLDMLWRSFDNLTTEMRNR